MQTVVAARVLKKYENSSLCDVNNVTNIIFISIITKQPTTVLIGAPDIPAFVRTSIYSSAIFIAAPAAIDTIGKAGFICDCKTALSIVVKHENTIASESNDKSGAANAHASASLGYIRSRIGFENTAIPAAAGILKAMHNRIEDENIAFASPLSFLVIAAVIVGISDTASGVTRAGIRLNIGIVRFV
jgi:hypothetical protein